MNGGDWNTREPVNKQEDGMPAATRELHKQIAQRLVQAMTEPCQRISISRRTPRQKGASSIIDSSIFLHQHDSPYEPPGLQAAEGLTRVTMLEPADFTPWQGRPMHGVFIKG